MPLRRPEVPTVARIAKEIEKLAKLVAALPETGDAAAKALPDAGAILKSVRKINSEIEAGIGEGGLGTVRLNTVGGEFSKIGAVLQARVARSKALAKAKPKTKRR